MSVFNLKTAALAIVAGVGLGGCTAYGPYGGLGVGVGYNSGYYDPYYSGRYYSGGYSPYGYGYGGYGSSYYGWNNGYYYPGTGYYVYDRYRRPYRWSDAQRRYWERRRGVATSNGGVARVIENWADFQNGTRTTNTVNRQRYTNQQRTYRSQPVVQQRVQTVQQQERRAARAEAREDRRERRGNNRRANRD